MFEIFARGPQISILKVIDELVQALRQETEKKLKIYLSSFRDFSRKADSVILLCFECTIGLNPQNSIKIVRAIFEKIKFFYFFSCELPLILGVGGKTKKKVQAHRTYFLVFNAKSHNLREIFLSSAFPITDNIFWLSNC